MIGRLGINDGAKLNALVALVYITSFSGPRID